MSPKYVDRDQKKKDIAIAALPLFARGFDSASIDQIAKAADIGKGTIYDYFDNKQAIFATAIEVWIDNGATQTYKVLQEIIDPIQRLNVFIEKTITLYNPRDPEVSGIFSAIQQQTISEAGVFFHDRQILSRLCRKSISIVTDILLDGIAKGVFRADIARDVETLARNMLSYLDGISRWSALLPEDEFNYPEHIDYFLKTFLSTILVKN